MSFKIVRNDITKMNTEAIVNTANDHVRIGSGCDAAVYQAAGREELLKYREEKIGFVPEGEAFITPGFHLQAKYIIHAVSPRFRGGDQGEEEKLRSCYRKSLQLAKENGIRSISFPLIAAGSFGYPREEAMRIAADEIHAFLLHYDMEISMVVFDSRSTELGKKIFPELESYIDQNYVQTAGREEYDELRFTSARSMDPDRTVSEIFQPSQPADISFRAASPSEVEKSSGKRFPGSIFKKKSAEKTASFASPEVNECAQCDETPFLDFTEYHESRLEERMKHLSDTFSEYLMYLIREKQMENVEVWKRAIIDKKIFSKIKNNVNYHPNKLTALCLCIGAKLNLDETRDLLARAGYALSPCDKTDIIFSYFIENQIYDMIEIDIQLEEHGLPCIIT